WFNRLKVRNKFLWIGIFLMPFLLGLGGTGIWGVIQVNSILLDVQGEQLPSIVNLETIAQKIEGAQSDFRQALLETNNTQVQKAVTAAQSDIAIAQKSLDAYLPAEHGATEEDMAKIMDSDWKSWLAQSQS